MEKYSKKLIVLSLSFLLTCVANLFAQEVKMTPYEQKREQLCTEAMEKLMNTMSAYDRTLFAVNLQNALREAHEEGDIFRETAIGENIIFKLCDISEGLQTEANLLTNSLDISNVYAGRSLQEWNEIGRWYKQERAKLEKTKTAEDIRREKERADALRDEPGIDGVKKRVAKSFKKWAKKGELEKTIAWQERMKVRGAEVFDSLCFVSVNAQINSNLLWKMLSDYDADREGVDWRYYYEDDKGGVRSYVDGFWPITVNQAQRGIGDWDKDKTYAKGIFLKGIDIYPATYHLAMAYEWDIRLGDPQSIPIAMVDVVGDLSYAVDADHAFDYSDYSLSLVSKDELREKIWETSVKYGMTGDKYECLLYVDKDSGWGYSRGANFDKIVPEYPKYNEERFFTKNQVTAIMARVTAYYDKKIEENKIQAFSRDFPLNRFFRDEAEVRKYMYEMSEDERGESVANYISSSRYFTEKLAQYTSAFKIPYDFDRRVLMPILMLDETQDQYKINMRPVYKCLIENTPYYAKKYRKYTIEEAIPILKNGVEMSKARAEMEREKEVIESFKKY